MKSSNHTLAVRVASTLPEGTVGYAVDLDGERQSEFTGRAARDRAIEAALRLAEQLRTTGPVLVVVDPVDGCATTARIVRSRLAS